MEVKEIAVLTTYTVNQDDTALVAAQLMKKYNVGSLVVIEQQEDGKVPIGMITDRDLAVEVCSREALPSMVTVLEIMSPTLLKVTETEQIYDVLEAMRSKAVRRVPIVDESGYLTGILSIDDILEFLAEEMNDIISILKKEQGRVLRQAM